MVAVMGLSSTLAGTITIGTGNAVEFGQGVVTAAACDAAITVTPESSFNASTTGGADSFTVSALTISGIGGSTLGTQNQETAVADTGCLGKVFEIEAYYDSVTVELGYGSVYKTLTVTLPTNSDSATAAENFSAAAWNSDGATWSKYTGGSVTIDRVATNTGGTTGAAAAPVLSNGATVGMKFTITGLRIPSTVTKFTIETRSPNSTRADEAAKRGIPST